VASFYLDHDVSVDLGELLRGQGHDVTLTRDLGLVRAHDGLQFLTARLPLLFAAARLGAVRVAESG